MQHKSYDKDVVISTPESSLLEKADSPDVITETRTWKQFTKFILALFFILAMTIGLVYIVGSNDPLRQWCKENSWMYHIAFWGIYVSMFASIKLHPYKTIFGVADVICSLYTIVYTWGVM